MKLIIAILMSFILSLSCSFGEDSINTTILNQDTSQPISQDITEKINESPAIVNQSQSEDEKYIQNYNEEKNNYASFAKILTFIVFCFLMIAAYLWKKSDSK